MVDKRSMSNCEKMFYLKTNLTGEAERVIRHVGPSDDNYMSAWKLLQERYNNPRLQVSALLNRLLSQSSHSSESASASAVKGLHDTIQECMHGLRNLGIEIDTWDPMLLHILTKKLDRSTLTLYEQSLSNPKDVQTMKNFLRFLETRFQSLEAIGVKGLKREDTERRRNMSYNKATTSITTQKKSCSMCKAQHPLFACRTFLNLIPSDRLSHVRKINLCVNCLQSGHTSYNCQLRGCVKCSKKHNSLVHLSTVARPKLGPSTSNSDNHQILLASNPETDNISGSENSVLAALSKNKKDGYVFLSTVIIKLAGQDGSSINCRAILDSGSQINILSERMIRKLNIPLSFRPMIIQGVGKSTKDSQRRANISLLSTTTNFTTRLEAVVLHQIVAPQPTKAFEITAWNIKLADHHFHQPGHIDLLIGAEFFHQLLCVGQIKLERNLPLLQNTLLGWIVTGKVNEESPTTSTCGIYTAEETSLEQSISKFWKLEELPYSTSKRTIAEERCEEYFNRSTSRNTAGRFVVNLPFADTTEKLGASSDIALSRFHELEHKLKRKVLYDQYIEFINEYI
ncbi:uncharacterized protein LOC129905347 [Episyrphus balteatus]|uniref:uncharacterized protein LOC129905347 n=1 Tax=Episyrphus balteatus TaxID=286459 RepID=UPI00248635EA|nr:uncharacterized protein LOC129905347 [Episyrphus balteatus]